MVYSGLVSERASQVPSQLVEAAAAATSTGACLRHRPAQLSPFTLTGPMSQRRPDTVGRRQSRAQSRDQPRLSVRSS